MANKCKDIIAFVDFLWSRDMDSFNSSGKTYNQNSGSIANGIKSVENDWDRCKDGFKGLTEDVQPAKEIEGTRNRS